MAPPKLPNLNPVGTTNPLPRSMVKYLQDFDRWARQIDAQAVRWSASGAIPPPGGSSIFAPTIAAGVIKSLPNSATKASMTADYLKQYSDVTDANGVVRAEWGNLAANGISAAQYGFRANDASGNPIFDSLGLIGVMKVLGTAVGTPGTLGSATSDTLITGSAVTFTLTRAQNVMTVANATCNSANQTGFISVYLDGAQFVEHYLEWGFGGPTVSSAISYSAQLSAGSHTIDLRYAVSAGAPAGSLFCNSFLMQCYLLGT